MYLVVRLTFKSNTVADHCIRGDSILNIYCQQNIYLIFEFFFQLFTPLITTANKLAELISFFTVILTVLDPGYKWNLKENAVFLILKLMAWFLRTDLPISNGLCIFLLTYFIWSPCTPTFETYLRHLKNFTVQQKCYQ